VSKAKKLKKNSSSKPTARLAKAAHILDLDAKTLHKNIQQSHKSAKKFHKQTTEDHQKVESDSINVEKTTGLSEEALKRSADEQLAEIALVGHRIIKKSA
jgi:acetate kinase